MADYMLRQGYTRSAEALVQHEGIESLVDIEVFKESSRIEASLQKRSVVEALNWCKENANALKKVKVWRAAFPASSAEATAQSTLEFDLRYQEFIELVRAHKPAEAIAYSRKHLVPWGATHMQQIRQAMVLLAFGPDTTCPPYKVSCWRVRKRLTTAPQKLFDESWWTTLCTKFRYTLLTLYSLMPLPMLSLSLHTGLAAMKTPSCFSSQPMSSNVDCPTCSTDLGKLAAIKGVPWAHHVNSTIVCKITGKVMEGEDEGREPLALPNGRVYSREALEQMAANNTGKIKCPRTGETYGFHELLKVYIS
jgi:macrophage erythroblast attacher